MSWDQRCERENWSGGGGGGGEQQSRAGRQAGSDALSSSAVSFKLHFTPITTRKDLLAKPLTAAVADVKTPSSIHRKREKKCLCSLWSLLCCRSGPPPP